MASPQTDKIQINLDSISNGKGLIMQNGSDAPISRSKSLAAIASLQLLTCFCSSPASSSKTAAAGQSANVSTPSQPGAAPGTAGIPSTSLVNPPQASTTPGSLGIPSSPATVATTKFSCVTVKANGATSRTCSVADTKTSFVTTSLLGIGPITSGIDTGATARAAAQAESDAPKPTLYSSSLASAQAVQAYIKSNGTKVSASGGASDQFYFISPSVNISCTYTAGNGDAWRMDYAGEVAAAPIWTASMQAFLGANCGF